MEGEDPMEDAAKALDSALAASDLDAEAALGRVRLYRLQGLAAEALSLLAQVIARYSWLVPAEVGVHASRPHACPAAVQSNDWAGADSDCAHLQHSLRRWSACACSWARCAGRRPWSQRRGRCRRTTPTQTPWPCSPCRPQPRTGASTSQLGTSVRVRTALTRQPGYALATALCLAHAATSHSPSAGDLLAALQTAEPRQWRLLSAAGAAFAKMATHDEDLAAAARQLAEAGVRAAPQEAKAQSAMAACLLALGDHERALALYNRAAEADVADVGAMTGGARCLVLLGRTEEARIKVDGLIEGFRSFQATDAEIMAVAGGGQGPEVPKLEGMGLAEQATLYYLRAALSWLAVQEGAGESAESEVRSGDLTSSGTSAMWSLLAPRGALPLRGRRAAAMVNSSSPSSRSFAWLTWSRPWCA